jgi:hypothetical protein
MGGKASKHLFCVSKHSLSSAHASGEAFKLLSPAATVWWVLAVHYYIIISAHFSMLGLTNPGYVVYGIITSKVTLTTIKLLSITVQGNSIILQI